MEVAACHFCLTDLVCRYSSDKEVRVWRSWLWDFRASMILSWAGDRAWFIYPPRSPSYGRSSFSIYSHPSTKRTLQPAPKERSAVCSHIPARSDESLVEAGLAMRRQPASMGDSKPVAFHSSRVSGEVATSKRLAYIWLDGGRSLSCQPYTLARLDYAA